MCRDTRLAGGRLRRGERVVLGGGVTEVPEVNWKSPFWLILYVSMVGTEGHKNLDEGQGPKGGQKMN